MAGPPVPPDVEARAARAAETLGHAALLSGLGARAAPLADAVRAALAAAAPRGRSCLEAGADLQLTVDAPGATSLRFGVRVSASAEDPITGASPLLAPADRDALRDALGSLLPPAFPLTTHFGSWLFCEGDRRSLFVDIRDGSPKHALDRARPLLDPAGCARLDGAAALLSAGHPWALRLDVAAGRIARVHVAWLVDRHREPGPLAAALGLGAAWEIASAALAGPLGERPSAHAWPWLVTTPLDAATPPSLRIGSSAIARAADDDAKRRRLLAAVRDLGGAADHADALLHLLASRVPEGQRFRVARAIEARADAAGRARLRLFFVPWPGPPDRQPAAGTRIAGSLDATISDADGVPSSAYRTTR